MIERPTPRDLSGGRVFVVTVEDAPHGHDAHAFRLPPLVEVIELLDTLEGFEAPDGIAGLKATLDLVGGVFAGAWHHEHLDLVGEADVVDELLESYYTFPQIMGLVGGFMEGIQGLFGELSQASRKASFSSAVSGAPATTKKSRKKGRARKTS